MRGVDIADIVDIDEKGFFSSIQIKGLIRQFHVNLQSELCLGERGEGEFASCNLRG